MLKDIRILGDTTAAEVYLNKGEVVFSTRYYPQDRKQALKINAQQIKGNLYQLDFMKFTKLLVNSRLACPFPPGALVVLFNQTFQQYTLVSRPR